MAATVWYRETPIFVSPGFSVAGGGSRGQLLVRELVATSRGFTFVLEGIAAESSPRPANWDDLWFRLLTVDGICDIGIRSLRPTRGVNAHGGAMVGPDVFTMPIVVEPLPRYGDVEFEGACRSHGISAGSVTVEAHRFRAAASRATDIWEAPIGEPL